MSETTKLWRECIQCESDFYIKEVDRDFFEAKGLELPKRCWGCRQKNKREAIEAKARQADEDRIARMNGKRKPARAPTGSQAHETTTVKHTRQGRNK